MSNETFLLDLDFEMSDDKKIGYEEYDEIYFNIYFIVIDGVEGWAIDF